jgi:hypothetical protein
VVDATHPRVNRKQRKSNEGKGPEQDIVSKDTFPATYSLPLDSHPTHPHLPIMPSYNESIKRLIH